VGGGGGGGGGKGGGGGGGRQLLVSVVLGLATSANAPQTLETAIHIRNHRLPSKTTKRERLPLSATWSKRTRVKMTQHSQPRVSETTTTSQPQNQRDRIVHIRKDHAAQGGPVEEGPHRRGEEHEHDHKLDRRPHFVQQVCVAVFETLCPLGPTVTHFDLMRSDLSGPHSRRDCSPL
jgi:hypothetical protein